MVNAAYHTANTFTSETVEPEVLNNTAESVQNVNGCWLYCTGQRWPIRQGCDCGRTRRWETFCKSLPDSKSQCMLWAREE